MRSNGSKSLRVALRAQPIDAAAAGQPLVNLGLALEPLDDNGLDARTFGYDLPVVCGNAFHLEGHSGGFGHDTLCRALRNKSKRPIGMTHSEPQARISGVSAPGETE